MASEYLQGGRLWSLSGQPVPVLSHSKEVIPRAQIESPVFQFVLMASGHGTGHHWKEPGSIFFTPSLKTFVHIN